MNTPTGLDLLLRAPQRRDRVEFERVRGQHSVWLDPWAPTPPAGSAAPMLWPAYVRATRAQARQRSGFAWLVLHQGELVGQVSLSAVAWGALCSGSVGYWVIPTLAGRWVAPTAAAAVIDWALVSRPDGLGLHRVEINVRPENSSSLAVVAKLALREEGRRERFLHIDHHWRDHRSFALTAEELPPDGLVARVQSLGRERRAGVGR